MKTRIFFVLPILLIGMSTSAQWNNYGLPITAIYTSSKVGIGTTSSSIYNFPLSFGNGVGNTKIALYDDGTTASAYGIGYQSSQFRFHLGSESAKFSFLNASDGPEIATIYGIGGLTLRNKYGRNVMVVDSGGNTFHYLNGVSGNPWETQFEIVSQSYVSGSFTMTGINGKNESSHFKMAVANNLNNKCDKCYSDLGKGGDAILSVTSDIPSSNLIVTNHSYLGSIKFSTKDVDAYSNQDKQRMEITYDGKVVIGEPGDFSASKPAYPNGYNLFVSKGIITSKIKVAVPGTPNWSDHVFQKEYALMDWQSVRSYIEKNHHLPGVPSAEEVVKEGIDVAAMDAKLLEKIEELTLYMIQLKEENQRIVKELQALKLKNK